MSDIEMNSLITQDEFSVATIENKLKIQSTALARIKNHEYLDLFRKYPNQVVGLISRNYPLQESLIEKYKDTLDWKELSLNHNLAWSENLLEDYIDYWDIQSLSKNGALPWSEELIERFAGRWEWSDLSCNESLPWSEELIERFAGRWEWSDLSCNESLPWSEELLDNFCDNWEWGDLSLNQALPWSEELIERFINNWDWDVLSFNELLPWSETLLEKYIDKWEWEGLSDHVAFTETQLDKYVARLDWDILPYNRNLPWSDSFIEKNKWFIYSKDTGKLFNHGVLFSYPSLWTAELIEEYIEDHINARDKRRLRTLCKGSWYSIPWSEGLINKYADRLDWDALSVNEYLPWSDTFINRYSDKLSLRKLFLNPAVTLSVSVLETLLSNNSEDELRAHSKNGAELICRFSEPDIISILASAGPMSNHLSNQLEETISLSQEREKKIIQNWMKKYQDSIPKHRLEMIAGMILHKLNKK